MYKEVGKVERKISCLKTKKSGLPRVGKDCGGGRTVAWNRYKNLGNIDIFEIFTHHGN